MLGIGFLYLSPSRISSFVISQFTIRHPFSSIGYSLLSASAINVFYVIFITRCECFFYIFVSTLLSKTMILTQEDYVEIFCIFCNISCVSFKKDKYQFFAFLNYTFSIQEICTRDFKLPLDIEKE